MTRTFALSGRRVWITGATSGIGEALTREIVQRGARVAASGRNLEALTTLSDELGESACLPIQLDVTDAEQVRAGVSRIEAAWGGLDLAILNAGICLYIDAAKFDAELIAKQLDVNVVGMARCIEAALPLLRRSERPQLAGMSSAVAYGALPRAEGYGASKAASKYMLEALRIHTWREPLQVSVICPGFVRTPLTDRNDFEMPARIEVDDAARRIADGLERGLPEIAFPRRFTWTFRALCALPGPLYERLMSRLVRQS